MMKASVVDNRKAVNVLYLMFKRTYIFHQDNQQNFQRFDGVIL